MRSAFLLPFACQPDLAATMDIQIPALAWQHNGGSWTRTCHLDGATAEVTVTAGDHTLRFDLDGPLTAGQREQLERMLRAQFPRQIASLRLTAHPTLAAMARHYQGVITMTAPAFEALVLTVLSQNRTGEIVRKVYPALDARCHGITPARIAGLGEHELAAIIRPAGPYKAPRLTATAQKITADGPGVFTRIVTTAPASQALSYLTSFPGVAHKTAACVLVFAAQTRDTLPVDTHLFRVAHRLGLVTHDGTLTPATRDTIVSTLLSYGPDLAPAHFLFLLAGRSTCTAGTPHCPSCFLRPRCPAGGAHTGHAADSAPW